MLSGYYLSERKGPVHVGRLFRIGAQVWFYSMLTFCVAVKAGAVPLSAISLLRALLPLTSNGYWFASAYFLMYLSVPVLNAVVQSLDRRQYKTLLLVALLLQSVWGTLFYWATDVTFVNNGYSFIWFYILYFIAAYFRKYRVTVPSGLCLLAYLAASAAGLFNRMLALRVENALHLNGFVNTVNGYQALATVIASAAMFLLFQNIHIRSDYWRRWVFRLAPLSFGVYLLHDSDFTRALLWRLVDLPRFGGALLPSLAYLTGAVLLIAVAGYAVDAVYQRLYRLLRLYGSSIRRVTFMFNAVDNDDLTFRFNDDPSKVDSAMLNAALNRIKEILLRAKMRAEERERYYQLIMECAQTGLITINDTGSVYQANGEALRIFGMQRMTHIRQLETSAPEACRALAAIRPGEKLRVTCVTESGEMALTLGCAEIVLEKQRLRVVTVGDINSELNEMQIESWSKLTRILTHEIMNSLAPVTSLSDTLLHLGRPLDRDVEQGLDTISATSRRLMAFVESFRRFTRIPEPQKEPFEVRELVRQAVALTAAEGGGIEIATDIEPQETLIYADKALMGQVAVNLLKNAREAVGGRPGGRIEIRARIDAAEHVVIEISNNGGAIPAEVTENIFTPFFTTKPDGSGIGLSVSRRIMQLHNGSLRLTANTDNRVTFTLLFG